MSTEKAPPLCHHCKKKLRRYRWRDQDWAKERGLEWGDYGDGKFCGLRCGYRYAVDSVGGKRGAV